MTTLMAIFIEIYGESWKGDDTKIAEVGKEKNMNVAKVSDTIDRTNRVDLIVKQNGATKQNLRSVHGD